MEQSQRTEFRPLRLGAHVAFRRDAPFCNYTRFGPPCMSGTHPRSHGEFFPAATSAIKLAEFSSAKGRLKTVSSSRQPGAKVERRLTS